jgi:hypothetical protein
MNRTKRKLDFKVSLFSLVQRKGGDVQKRSPHLSVKLQTWQKKSPSLEPQTRHGQAALLTRSFTPKKKVKSEIKGEAVLQARSLLALVPKLL